MARASTPFATLKSPGRGSDSDSGSPAGVRSVTTVTPSRTVVPVTCQSAGMVAAELAGGREATVTSGTSLPASRSASRRPHASSTQTTARWAKGGVNSTALASKYSSIEWW